MNLELYQTLCDDAIESIVQAKKKLEKVKAELFKAGDPAYRFANRKVDPIIDKLLETLMLIDELPAGDES